MVLLIANSARFTGRQRHFFEVPERTNVNSGSDLIVNSVIAWSFYPKLLVREGKGWRNIANNQTVSLLPTSVNKRPEHPLKWVSFYHIMQSRSRYYNAHETSAVQDFAVALLCGDVEFKVCLLITVSSTQFLRLNRPSYRVIF